jgi:hypothetical protein
LEIQLVRAKETPAVVVVVYGNRAYEDALLELRDTAREADFAPVAGAVFVGGHSFSTEATPIARGRPDSEDLKRANGIGKVVRQRMSHIHSLEEVPFLRVPGKFPY